VISALLSFLVLLSLLWRFERDRARLDPLRVGLAVFVPLLLVIAIRVAAARAGIAPVAAEVAAVAVFLVATWCALWRFVAVPGGAALAYAAVVVVVNVVAATLLGTVLGTR